MIECHHFINGEWCLTPDRKAREIINPFDQSIIAHAQEANIAIATQAIESARTSFDSGSWRKTSSQKRSQILQKISEIVIQNKEELALLETLDTGKTLAESRWDMDDIANVFSYYAQLAQKIEPESIQNNLEGTQSILYKDAIGVAALICPWNYPLLQASWKVAPALAAGCSFILKPSEITPICTTRFIELICELDIPKGVINLVLGSGTEIGEVLTSHPNIDMVSFTGGIQTGRLIMEKCALTMKKVALELGGKNPHIVFADADYEIALDRILGGVYFHAGQICSAGSRVLIEKSLEDKIIADLKSRIQKIKLGSGQDLQTRMGPLVSAEHRQKVEGYIGAGIQEGARLECGGKRPPQPELQQGFFLEPTLFSNCTNDMTIVKEEMFGPVITLETFTNEDEALTRANDSHYGLSAGIQTKNKARIEKFTKELRYGTVWINDFNVYFPQAPWGGFRRSGIGRELGQEGLAEYQEIKHVFTNHKPEALNWF